MNPTRDVPDERSFPRWALPRTMPPHDGTLEGLDSRQDRNSVTGTVPKVGKKAWTDGRTETCQLGTVPVDVMTNAFVLSRVAVGRGFW